MMSDELEGGCNFISTSLERDEFWLDKYVFQWFISLFLKLSHS